VAGTRGDGNGRGATALRVRVVERVLFGQVRDFGGSEGPEGMRLDGSWFGGWDEGGGTGGRGDGGGVLGLHAGDGAGC